MRIRWYGQSAFLLTAERSVFVDPFGRPGEQLAARGIEFRYPPIAGVTADLVLVTHEHFDHNGVEVVDGEPPVLRSTAGRLTRSWRPSARAPSAPARRSRRTSCWTASRSSRSCP